MSDTPQEQRYRRPVGFFEALSASRKIERYHDLIMIENFTYIHDQEERKRLGDTYSEYFEPNKLQPKYSLLRKEISKSTVAVYKSLMRINAPTNWLADSEDLEYDYEKGRNVKNKKTEKYNVILDRQYPVFRKRKGFDDADTTYPMLDQSKAVYDAIWKGYWLKLINPLWWVAKVLRLPISLMEHMGMDTQSTNINKFIYWLIQAIVGLTIAFIALKLGIEINFGLSK